MDSGIQNHRSKTLTRIKMAGPPNHLACFLEMGWILLSMERYYIHPLAKEPPQQNKLH
jgi:hypothetical protein